jgi:hypothetical protein
MNRFAIVNFETSKDRAAIHRRWAAWTNARATSA